MTHPAHAAQSDRGEFCKLESGVAIRGSAFVAPRWIDAERSLARATSRLIPELRQCPWRVDDKALHPICEGLAGCRRCAPRLRLTLPRRGSIATQLSLRLRQTEDARTASQALPVPNAASPMALVGRGWLRRLIPCCNVACTDFLPLGSSAHSSRDKKDD
jgi:hypothetical protein